MRTIWKINLPHADVLDLLDPVPLHVGPDGQGYAAMWVEHTVEDDGAKPSPMENSPRYAINQVGTGDPVPLPELSKFVGTITHPPYVTHFYFVTVPSE